MHHIEKLYLMVHPLTYVDHEHEYRDRDFFRLALECEDRVAQRWRKKISEIEGDEILVLLPSRPMTGSMEDLLGLSKQSLGERLILVNRSNSDWQHKEFWDTFPEGSYEVLGKEVRDILVSRRSLGSLEDLTTGIQAYSYVQELKAEMARLDMTFDPETVRGEAWGESFEGCVAKYSQMMGDYLGLTEPLEVGFEMTVPDATFLLRGTFIERVILPEGVRLYLFRSDHDVPIGMFYEPFRKSSDAIRSMRIEIDPSEVRVVNKSGKEAQMRDDPTAEVRFADGVLQMPLIWGCEYGCIFGDGYTSEEFRTILSNATVSTVFGKRSRC